MRKTLSIVSTALLLASAPAWHQPRPRAAPAGGSGPGAGPLRRRRPHPAQRQRGQRSRQLHRGGRRNPQGRGPHRAGESQKVASLRWHIADANGLTLAGDAALQAGQTLSVPKLALNTNNQDSLQP